MDELAYWKMKAERYEHMFLWQKEITDGFREVIEQQEKVIEELKFNKTLDKKIAKSECI